MGSENGKQNKISLHCFETREQCRRVVCEKHAFSAVRAGCGPEQEKPEPCVPFNTTKGKACFVLFSDPVVVGLTVQSCKTHRSRRYTRTVDVVPLRAALTIPGTKYWACSYTRHSTAGLVDGTRMIQGSPSGCGRLEIRGVSQVSQVAKGEHRRSYEYVYEALRSSLVLHRCCTVTARMLLKFRGSAGGIVPRCVQDSTTYHAHTHAHRSTVRSCHKTKTLRYGCCCIVAVTTSKAYGVIQVHSRSRDSATKIKRSKKC